MSDKEILACYHELEEPERALKMLMDQYQERLYWHLKRMLIAHEDVDDVLQNTFIKVWKGLGNFRAEAQLFTWLYRIATNEAISLINKKKKRATISFQLSDSENHDLTELIAADPYFSGDEASLKLEQAIQQLPEKQKAVFCMKYFDDLKYAEMAEILDCSLGNLKAAYHHASKKIETFLKAE